MAATQDVEDGTVGGMEEVVAVSDVDGTISKGELTHDFHPGVKELYRELHSDKNQSKMK